MTEIYLTEQSITFFVQFILSFVNALYLLSLREKSRPTWYLIVFFAGLALTAFFSLLDSMWRGVPQYYATQFQFIGIFIGLAALIQFAYWLPQKSIDQRSEYKLISFFSALMIILVHCHSILNLYKFEFHETYNNYTIFYVQIVIIEFIWAMFVLLRHTVKLSTHQGPWWRAFIKPEGKTAQATHAFALLLIIPVLSALTVGLEKVLISPAQSGVIRIASIMVMSLGLVIVHLNYMFERTTIMVKLVAISLATILSVLGMIGILIAPLLSRDYPNASLPMQQRLHFEPNGDGFTVSERAFKFETDFGEALTLEDDDSQVITLPFAFPFYDQHWTELYINSDGAVSFDDEMTQAYFRIDDFRQPAILAMLVDLNPMANGQVLFKSDIDRVIITWNQVGEFDFPNNLNTFQLVLYPDGTFDISYDTLTLKSPFKPFDHHEGHVIGVLPGTGQPPQFIDLTNNLPLISQGAQGLIKDYQLPYRRYLHQYYAPLFYLIAGSSLLIIFGFPIFFRTNLIKPLNALVDGVREVNQGQLDVRISAIYNDEIGFLTSSFNNMVHSIRQGQNALEEINIDLEKRVFERTKQLSESNEQLFLAKEQAEDAQEIAESANQAKSTFLANMSHELRTPLNAILGFGQLMMRSQTLSNENQEHIDIISRSGEHLLTLINNVLDLSKIEAGQITLNKKDFDLYRLLDDLENMFSLKAHDKGLYLLFERSNNLPQYVHTDHVKLRQVLINLLNNALKFTTEGGVSIRASQVNLTDKGHPLPSLHFEVEDSGQGIASEELDSLFEAFVQTESGRSSQEGSGLGLPISRQFVKLMGGEMTVKSEVGRGSVFAFDVQVEIMSEGETQEQEPTPRVIALQPNQESYRILIVDDQYNNRLLLTKLLSPLGFGLRNAQNGQEAIDIWQEWQPHLIWMDMRMPIMDGYDATRQIRAKTNRQTTAIIALSANSFGEEQALVFDAGCDDFMRKPFRESEIFDMMHKHIGVRYVYEETKIATRQEKIPLFHLTPAALARLPMEWRAALKQATMEANMIQINKLIEESRSYDAVIADQLTILADEFEYSEILQLLQKVK